VGNTGEGVVIGAVDSGFDYFHEDFRTGDGESRFYSIWDQSYFFGTPPEGYSVGREFTHEALNQGTAATQDRHGHGTHVMGIAAGNGRHTGNGEPEHQYVGVAPEATLVGVKTTLVDADVIDGVRFVFERAAELGMDAVVNLSLGGRSGPRDGTGAMDRAIDALCGPGRIVVVAAGNSADDQLHARGTIPASDDPGSLDLVFTVRDYTSRPGPDNDLVFFDVWYEGTEEYEIVLISPDGTATEPIPRGTSSSVLVPDQCVWQIDHGVTEPSNGDVEVFLALLDPDPDALAPAAGDYTIRFNRVTSTGAPIDAWLTGWTMPVVFTQGQSLEATITTPGSATEAITVGAYTSRTEWTAMDGSTKGYYGAPAVGEIAPFSSRGPLRNGSLKPDIVAPGFGIVSTLSGDANSAMSTSRIMPDGVHWIREGTSMSCPMVTGMAALILRKEPGLTPAQVKSRLYRSARSDDFTGTVPNPDWGYGKLGAGAADMTPPTATLATPNGRERFFVEQVVEIRWWAEDNHGVRSVDLRFSTDGGESFPHVVATGEANDGSYWWTVPDLETLDGRIRIEVEDSGGNRFADMSDAVFKVDPKSAAQVPSALYLAASQPNPLNRAERAQIWFGLSRPGPVELRVFDATGREVALVAEGDFPAGSHRVVWNARDHTGQVVGSGIYFYRIRTQEGTLARKLTVLR
jgi:subtilisin family serine protease